MSQFPVLLLVRSVGWCCDNDDPLGLNLMRSELQSMDWDLQIDSEEVHFSVISAISVLITVD